MMCAAGGIDDNAIEGKLACLVVKAQPGFQLTLTTAGLGVGGQLAEAVAASELNGFAMAASDDVYALVDINELWMFDLAKDIRAQILFMSKGGAGDSGIAFVLNAKGVADGQVMSDAGLSPDGTATFSGQTTTAVNSQEKTDIVGLGAAGVFAADDSIMLRLALSSSGTASADEVLALAIRLYGTQQITHSSREKQFT